MNEEVIVEKKRNSPPRGAGGAKKSRRFTPAEKLKAVRLYREEGFSMALVSQELGISKGSVEHWIKAYELGGEAGLQSKMAADWDRKFAALVAFHKRQGHFEVPPSGATAELHRWITNLRFRMTNYSLRADHRQRLDQIGFPTKSPVLRQDTVWIRNLDRLQAFYQKNGHFKVSRQRGANSGLRHWVVAQRSLKKLGRLRPDRQQRLESIGFVW